MTKNPNINVGLHLVRGACALGVAVYHYLSWTHGYAIESVGAFYVYIFFIVSAVAMMIAHGSDFDRAINLPLLKIFYIKRIARVLPLLALVAFGVGIEGSIRAGSWQIDTFAKAYLTATGLFGLQMPGMNSGAVAAWSLGIEAVFYLIFPIVALLIAGARLRTLAVAIAILLVGQHAALRLLRGQDGAEFWFNYANPLMFAPYFAIGLAVFRAPIRMNALNFWLTLAILVCIASVSIISPVNVYRSPMLYVVLTGFSGAVVMTAYAARVPEALRATAIFLGDISYALYLTHWFTHRFSAYIASSAGLPTFLQFPLFVGMAIGIAYCIHIGFELPAKKAILAWNKGRSIIAAREGQVL
ncbi:acyltransferase family protein [Mesorhizobium sp. A623]